MNNDTKSPAQCGALSNGLRIGAVCVRPKGHSKENGLGDYHGTEQDANTAEGGYYWSDYALPAPVAGEKREGIQLPPQDSPEGLVLPPLEHGLNCGAWKNRLGEEVNSEDCTCGLRHRISLSTEQTMHKAWRKRAEEAELREQDALRGATETEAKLAEALAKIAALEERLAGE